MRISDSPRTPLQKALKNPVRIEFRKADLPAELQALVRFDHKVFPRSDWFPRSYWKQCEAYWMIVDGVTAGCSAFDFSEDSELPIEKGTLFIASTGILPGLQGMGLGRLMKAWQISYARRNGFHKLVTTTRKKNAPMIALNRSVGFRAVRSIRGYYSEPADTGIVMELLLKPARAK